MIMVLKWLEELKTKTMQSSIGFSETKDTLGDDHYRELNNKILALSNELQSLKNEFAKWLKEMQDALN